MTKIRKYFILSFIIASTILFANFLVRTTSINQLPVFELTAIFTYFGVLIGISLTIYKFGLSMVTDLKNKIDCNKDFSLEQKRQNYNLLISGFSEIKQDIWLIFYAIIVALVFAILSIVPNPFGWDLEKYKIPDTVNLSLFILATIAVYDIIKTLFNLSEINFELMRSKTDS